MLNREITPLPNGLKEPMESTKRRRSLPARGNSRVTTAAKRLRSLRTEQIQRRVTPRQNDKSKVNLEAINLTQKLNEIEK